MVTPYLYATFLTEFLLKLSMLLGEVTKTGSLLRSLARDNLSEVPMSLSVYNTMSDEKNQSSHTSAARLELMLA